MCDSDMYFHLFVLSDDQDSASIKTERSPTVGAKKRWDGRPEIDAQLGAAEFPREPETAL
jgi:hypothetical protein